MNKNKILLILGILLFSLVLIGSSWFNNDWKYKKQISITENSGTTLTDYSILLHINYDSHMNSDFSDLRFLNSAEDTELGYWIENYTASSDAYVWVKIPSLTASSVTNIYMYYGNSGASTTSNCGNAFLFGDDFSSGTLDTTKWTQHGTITFANGLATGTTSETDGLFGKTLIPINTVTIIRINPSSTSTSARPGVESSFDNPYSVPGLGIQYYEDGYLYTDTYTTAINQVKEKTYTANWHTIKMIWTSGSVRFFEDSTELTQHTTKVPDNTYSLYDQIDGAADYDYIYTRVYASSEPTYSIGDEQSQSTGPEINLNFPLNNSNFSTASIIFNGTVYDDINLVNVTLILDGTENETNSSGINNSNYIFTKTLGEGEYNWTYKACDNSSKCTTADYRYFKVDLYNPIVNIIYPDGQTFDLDYINTIYPKLNLNWSVSDPNLDTCWYEYNGTNNTINCNGSVESTTIIENTTSYTGWTSSPAGMPITTCGSYSMFGGYNQFGQTDYAQKTYNLPPGTYNISWNYYAVDSWDGELGRMSINGDVKWSKSFTSGGTNICGGSWGETDNVPGDIYYYEYVHPGGEFTIKFDSTLNQEPDDESWGFNNINITNLNETGNTFQTNEQTNVTLWANDTFGRLNSDTTYWSYKYVYENTTTFTTDCRDSEINWTDLPDGTYEYNVTTCNIYDYCNSTETRIVYLDTNYPLIEYTSNSDSDNTTGDFNVKDWIFVNVSVNELHEQYIKFSLWNSTDIINETIYTDKTRHINWTNLPESMYFYNVTICDYADNCNSTDIRNYGKEKITLSIGGLEKDWNVELGSGININATDNLETIYVDVDHPSYGINYSSGLYKTGFELIIDWFRNTLFSNGNDYQTLTFNSINSTNKESTISAQNFTIKAHQYDYIENMSINLSGNVDAGNSTSYEPQIIIYNAGNMSEIDIAPIDRAFYGELIGNNIFVNKLFDNNQGTDLYIDTTNLSFENPGDKLVYFYLDKNADLTNFTLNLTGYEYGFDFSDTEFKTYEDNVLTNATVWGGYIMPNKQSPMNFSYDDYSDSSINNTLWGYGYGTGSGYIGDYSADLTTSETPDYIRLQGNFHEEADSSTYSCQGNGEILFNEYPECQSVAGYDTYVATCSDASSQSLCEAFPDWNYNSWTNCGDSGTCSWDVATSGDTAEAFINQYLTTTKYGTNLFASDAYNFDLEYYKHGDEESTHGDCDLSLSVLFGGTTIWTAPFQRCEDEDGKDCDEYMKTDGPINFNILKNNDGTWSVKLEGTVTTYGSDLYDGDCTDYVFTYNYADGWLYKDYTGTGSCPSDSNTSLQNEWIFSNIDTITSNAIKIKSYDTPRYDGGDYEGCESLDFDIKLHELNQTLSYIDDGVYYSKSIFDSSADITQLNSTIIAYSGIFNPTNASYYPYISTDNGEHYQTLKVDGNDTIILNPGKNVKWYSLLDVNETGYVLDFPFITDIGIQTEKSYPSNVSLDFGNDGIYDYVGSGELNSNINVDLTNSNISEAFTGTPEVGKTWLVPLRIFSSSAGIIQLDNINLTYNPNPVYLNLNSLKNYQTNLTESGNLSIFIGAVNGTLNLTDLRYDYMGGNDTIKVTAHNKDYSINVSRLITYYYSSFKKSLPYTWTDQIFFLPRTNSSKNVSAYGQTSTIPLFNITTTNYGGMESNLSLKVDKSYPCLNLTWSNSSTIPSSGNKINTTWQDISFNLDYLSNQGIWIWADLENCDSTDQRILSPILNISTSCEDCYWDGK